MVSTASTVSETSSGASSKVSSAAIVISGISCGWISGSLISNEIVSSVSFSRLLSSTISWADKSEPKSSISKVFSTRLGSSRTVSFSSTSSSVGANNSSKWFSSSNACSIWGSSKFNSKVSALSTISGSLTSSTTGSSSWRFSTGNSSRATWGSWTVSTGSVVSRLIVGSFSTEIVLIILSTRALFTFSSCLWAILSRTCVAVMVLCLTSEWKPIFLGTVIIEVATTFSKYDWITLSLLIELMITSECE